VCSCALTNCAYVADTTYIPAMQRCLVSTMPRTTECVCCNSCGTACEQKVTVGLPVAQQDESIRATPDRVRTNCLLSRHPYHMQHASQLRQETRECDAAACISNVVPLCSSQAISICGIPPGLVSPTGLSANRLKPGHWTIQNVGGIYIYYTNKY
jgi:hypothetical protein